MSEQRTNEQIVRSALMRHLCYSDFRNRSVPNDVVAKDLIEALDAKSTRISELEAKVKELEALIVKKDEALKQFEYTSCPDCGGHEIEEFYVDGKKYFRGKCPYQKIIREALALTPSSLKSTLLVSREEVAKVREALKTGKSYLLCEQECFDTSDGHGYEMQDIFSKQSDNALTLLDGWLK